MTIEIKYKIPYNANGVGDIREFVCRVQNGTICKDENPLPKFNEILDVVASTAFEDGKKFAKKYPDL